MKRLVMLLFSLAMTICLALGITACGKGSGGEPEGGGPEGGGNQDDTNSTEGLSYELDEETDTYVVTGIGTALDGVDSLALVIPDTYQEKNVTSIGGWAFYQCNKLSSVTIGKNVTSIGSGAFYECSGLTGELQINDGINVIAEYAFYKCNGLTGELRIPNSVTSIGKGAFGDCSGLNSIIIGDGVTSIGSEAFVGTAYYNDSENWDGDGVLYITNCLIKARETISGDYAIPSGTRVIAESAFYRCVGLTGELKIPNSVIAIGDNAFEGCIGLTKFDVESENQNYSSQDGILYNQQQTEILFVPKAIEGKIAIPESVASIPEGAFEGRSGLVDIVIPESVISIGSGALSGCDNLASLTIPFVGATKNGTENTHFGFIFGAGSYNENSDYVPSSLRQINITGGTSVEEYAFYGCTWLTSITIPDSVTSIGSYAFYGCNWLANLTIPFVGATKNGTENTHFGFIFGAGSYNENFDYVPSSLRQINITGGTSIEEYAFYNCRGLTGITIPVSVTSIGDGALDGCDGLEKIEVATENQNYSSQDGILYNKEKTAFIHIPKAIQGTVTIPNGVMSIGSNAFRGCSGLTSITIPDSVTSIGSYAFGYSGLTSIEIPDSVTSIGKQAFYYSGLTSVTIGEGVTSIGNSAFTGCSGLKKIEVATGNQNYSSQDGILYNKGKTAFIHIPKAIQGTVTIPNGVTSIGNQAFSWCTKLTSIIIPDSVTSIGYEAFYYCSNLTSIVMGSGVTSIGNYAFEYCRGLTSIVIGSGVTSIGKQAFYYCDTLQTVYYNGTAEEWDMIEIDTQNDNLTRAKRYYFSEDEPTAEKWASYKYWWHYDPRTSRPTPWT